MKIGNGEKIFTKKHLVNDYYPKHTKNSLKLNTKKRKILIKK